jgi:hypothetical protein
MYRSGQIVQGRSSPLVAPERDAAQGPCAGSRPLIGRNAFRRETLLNAILIYVEEDAIAAGTADSA